MTEIRVGCSNKMTTRGESELIRFPKKLREKLGVEPQMIIIVEQEKVVLRLRVRPSFDEDLNTPEGDEIAFLDKINYDLLTKFGTTISIQEVQPFTGITLGADPECYIWDYRLNQLIVAEAAFKKFIKYGLINTLGIRVSDAGYAGWDGGRLLLEFRPDPVNSNEKQKLTYNIKKLLLSCKEIFPSHWGFLAHTYFGNVAAGFHLHFGLPEVYITGKGQIDDVTPSKLEELQSSILLPYQSLGKLIVDALNFYIGVPLILTDAEQSERVWKSHKYGRSGDALRHHQYTLEYRIPGGKNMISPEATNNLINASHLVVANCVSLLRELTSNYATSAINDTVKLKSRFTEALGLNDLNAIKQILDQEIIPSPDQAEEAFGIIQNHFSTLPNYNIEGQQFMNGLQNNILGRCSPHLNILKTWETC